MNLHTRPDDRGSTGSDAAPLQIAGRSRLFAGTAPHEALRGWRFVTGLVVAMVGLGVMVGWFLDAESLTRIGPGLPTMKFNTAFCLALLGTGVVAGGRSEISRVASATVGVIASVSLAEYLTGWNAGIDEALFLDPAAGMSYPGRMPFVTAVCLCLGAIGLFALRLGRRRLATVAAVVLLAIGWLGCLGYVFGVRALYEVGHFSTMATHTAASLVILGVGLLASIPNGPLAWIVRGDDPGATVLRRILPLALVGVPVAGGVTLMGEHAGWYGPEVSMALMVVVASCGISAAAMHMARVVNRSHAARGLATQTLHDLNETLEARIEERTAELVTSETWARALAGSAPVGIFHMDTHGKYTYVNDQWCEIAGVSGGGALRGGGWESLLHPDDRDWVAGEWRGAVAAGLEFDAEFRVVQPSGEILWVHSHSVRVDGAGDSGGYVGTVTDITSRRKAEADLRETEELFRITFDSSPVGMALVDANGLVVRANRALGELTNRPLAELSTMRLQSVIHSDNVVNDEPGVGTAGADQRITRADGSFSWASIRYAQIGEDSAGDPGFMVVQFVETTERREFEGRLAHMANHDSLTGLLNRRSYEAALANHVAQCNRYGPSGAVLILDLDHFKQINDTRGHAIGDQVIVRTAQLLRQRLRASDLFARVGGDEFAVLLTVGDAAAARTVAQNLVEGVRAYAATIAEGDEIALSASVGIAVFDDVDRSSDEMLINADLAMYDAKGLGRDRWAEFAADKHEEPRSKARLTWINRIEADIDNDAFVLHAQPIVDLATGETVQMELLLRMNGDRGDLILPDSFLYIAERYGLSNRLDAWVLAQAFEVLEATSADLRPLSVAVNVSGTSIGDDDLLALLERRVRSGGFVPERLVLQVAESAATGNIAATRAFAERFRDLGCRLTFGSCGFDVGSVCYLEQLPFDFIRLDGELITDCLEDSSNRGAIGYLIDLARSLGKQTIAEQVSSDSVRGFLRRRGVDHGQGFQLGPPVPLEEAIPTFTSRRDRPDSTSELTPAY